VVSPFTPDDGLPAGPSHPAQRNEYPLLLFRTIAGCAAAQTLAPLQSRPVKVDVEPRVHAPREGSAPDDQPLRAGEVLDGKYRVGAPLGSGAMGLVFEAHHLLLGKPVAVKVLRPELTGDDELRRRFEIEARAAAAVAHPNVVTVTDMGRTAEGAVYFVMDRLVGETLAERLDQVGRLDLMQAVHIAVEVLDGLEAAHALGLIHRDLKLENVFLARSPQGKERVKILDFGVARVAMLGGSAGATQAGAVMGTPEFMAPEQARGDRRMDARVDIYAVGVLLYKTLSGRAPFTGSNGLDVMARLLTDIPPGLDELCPELPAEVVSVVMAALARDRGHRPRNAAEFRTRLLAACAERPTGLQQGRRSSVSDLVTLDQHPSTGERPAFVAPAFVAPAVTPAQVDLAVADLEVADLAVADEPLALEPRVHTPPPVSATFPRARRRSTTRSAAVAPPRSFEISQRVRNLLLALVAALVVLGMWRSLHWDSPLRRLFDRPLPRTAAVEPASDTGEPARVTVTIDVHPAGAALELDGEPLMRQRLDLLRSNRTHVLRASKDDFDSGSVEFVADDWKTIVIRLSPVHHRKPRPHHTR
jgi:serine/threonine protein kinase